MPQPSRALTPAMTDLPRTIVERPDASSRARDAERSADGRLDDEIAPIVPGYELVGIIGRGGMGVVWEAIEHRLERRVAVKVRRSVLAMDDAAEIWSEARLAARVADPGVVAVHDIGTTLDGRPYYTMDLVQGSDLTALLREGPLPQSRALSIASQIARAVGAAHAHGIAHRDLKPGNIIIDRQGRARVLDFGLAHRVAGPESDRFAAAIFGTPSYMSPEQVLAEPVGPPADIHAIGILLYEMLTGVRPFTGGGMDEVMAAIAASTPDPPISRNPALHVDVDRVVRRCLEKKPADRFPSAMNLAVTLYALIEGRPIQLQSAPSSIPPRRPTLPAPPPRKTHERDSAPVHQRWSWRLRSSPARLWPLVANTERVNRAIGLPEVEFEDTADEEGASHRTGRSRVLGMELAWREHPFEWTKDREHSVFREYVKGPIEAMWNRVQLVHAGGQTELVHELWFVPRNILGRMAVSFELSQKIGKNLDELYRRIDATLSVTEDADGDGADDPFEPVFDPSASQHRLAEKAAEEMVTLGKDPHLVRCVVDHVLYQPTKVLERIRPYALADAWGKDRAEVLGVLLESANRGLLDIGWELICPRCLASHESSASLKSVERLGVCVPCNRTYERDLRESVELVFRPHPALRDARPTTYCAGAPALRPHVLAQQLLAPGEARVLKLDLPSGDYRIVASHVLSPFAFTVSTAAYMSELGADILDDVIDARPSTVRSGALRIALTNATAHDQILRVEIAHGENDRVTAADVLTSPDFSDLFSQEMLAEGEHMTVSRMAFVFARLDARAKLLARHGDAGAWAVLRRLDSLFDETVRAHSGTIVPSSLDGRVAAFNTSESALSAAIAAIAAIRRPDVGAVVDGESLVVAVHDGQCLVLTREGRTEYFGKTLHRGMALLDDARPGGIALSTSVAADRAVAVALESAGVTWEIATTEGGPYKGTRVVRLALA